MNYQIATTHEQSQRLLTAGVNPYTADMTLSHRDNTLYELLTLPFHYGCLDEKDLPAWSLSQLIGIVPNMIDDSHYFTFQKIRDGNHGIAYMKMEWDSEDSMHTHSIGAKFPIITKDPVEGMVRMIEQLLSNGYTLNTTDQ